MRPERLRRARPALGTLVAIAIERDAAIDAEGEIAATFAEIESLEAQLSAHRADSELSLLCTRAVHGPQPVGAALREVLQTAIVLHRQSGGIFDVTRPLDAAQAVSGDDLELDADGRVRLHAPLRIDLGGIAKGYVIDRAIERLQRRGVRGGSVNAGGDLRVFGEREEPVALRFADGFRTVAQLCDGAFAASRPGPRPMSSDPSDAVSHIDGRSRRPVAAGDSVAVFAPTAMLADALTKVALVCPTTMDALGGIYAAQWRRYPFDLDTVRHAA